MNPMRKILKEGFSYSVFNLINMEFNDCIDIDSLNPRQCAACDLVFR